MATYCGERNPNYKGGVKPKICLYCNISFVAKNPYQKRKFCSHKCSSDFSIGRKVIMHENTLKYIKLKIENGKNNPNKKCICGNKKDLKAIKCIKCFRKSIKRNNKCIICGNIHQKQKIVKTCSVKCASELKKKMYLSDKNPNWKGGIMTENKKVRQSEEYNIWRISVFERDKYTCQDCGIIGNKLHSHHIKSFSKYKELRLDINNGLTLCFKCHKKLHNNMNMNN